MLLIKENGYTLIGLLLPDDLFMLLVIIDDFVLIWLSIVFYIDYNLTNLLVEYTILFQRSVLISSTMFLIVICCLLWFKSGD